MTGLGYRSLSQARAAGRCLPEIAYATRGARWPFTFQRFYRDTSFMSHLRPVLKSGGLSIRRVTVCMRRRPIDGRHFRRARPSFIARCAMTLILLGQAMHAWHGRAGNDASMGILIAGAARPPTPCCRRCRLPAAMMPRPSADFATKAQSAAQGSRDFAITVCRCLPPTRATSPAHTPCRIASICWARQYLGQRRLASRTPIADTASCRKLINTPLTY